MERPRVLQFSVPISTKGLIFNDLTNKYKEMSSLILNSKSGFTNQ